MDKPAYQVYLNVYDVVAAAEGQEHVSALIQRVNKIGRDLGIGGVFHGAIQLADYEWSFGWCESGSGVYAVRARRNPMYVYRETIDLGHTAMSKPEVKALLHALKQEWRGDTYELLSRNCCHFCAAFAQALGVKPLPSWVNRFAMSAEATMAFTTDALAMAKHLTSNISRTAGWVKDSVGRFITGSPQQQEQAGGAKEEGSQQLDVVVPAVPRQHLSQPAQPASTACATQNSTTAGNSAAGRRPSALGQASSPSNNISNMLEPGLQHAPPSSSNPLLLTPLIPSTGAAHSKRGLPQHMQHQQSSAPPIGVGPQGPYQQGVQHRKVRQVADPQAIVAAAAAAPGTACHGSTGMVRQTVTGTANVTGPAGQPDDMWQSHSGHQHDYQHEWRGTAMQHSLDRRLHVSVRPHERQDTGSVQHSTDLRTPLERKGHIQDSPRQSMLSGQEQPSLSCSTSYAMQDKGMLLSEVEEGRCALSRQDASVRDDPLPCSQGDALDAYLEDLPEPAGQPSCLLQDGLPVRGSAQSVASVVGATRTGDGLVALPSMGHAALRASQ